MMAVVAPSWAIPLSNTNLTWTEFTSLADISNVKGTPFSDTFAFAGGPVGEITSGVFAGTGDATGLYVYVYQVRVYTTPLGKVDEVSIPFAPSAYPLSTVTGISSFYIGSGVPSGFLYGQGNKAPTSSTFTSLPPVVSFAWGDPNQIYQGQDSYIFGFFHSAPPVTTQANLSDAGPETRFPFVYTPSPEPSVFLLFGIGLMGGAVLSRGRKRMKKA